MIRAAAAIAVVFLAGRLALPLLVPTAAIEEDLQEAIAAWTGARLEAGAPPQIEFWPYPTVTLRDVKLTRSGGDSGELATADRISATFDLLDAVRGRLDFDEIELVRPDILIVGHEDGSFNWRANGWLMDAITAARSNDENQSVETDRGIGTLTIVDGKARIDDRTRNVEHHVTDLNGTIRWPRMDRSLDVSLRGVLNGEVTEWTFVCDRPLTLFSGLNAAIKTSLSSDPMNASFEGVGSLSGNTFFAGSLQLSTPSLGHLLAWQGRDISAVGKLGQIGLDAKLNSTGYSVKLDDLELKLQDANATGVLDLHLKPQTPPRIGGTLAFDEIDLRSLLSAFSPLPGSAKAAQGDHDASLTSQLEVDLRLSAQKATFDPFALEDVAAGLRIGDGSASFDIGDSTFMGGRMSGRIALADRGFESGGQLQMTLSGVDLAPIIDTLGLTGPLPVGRATADFELSTDRPLWATTSSDVSGVVRLRMGNGILTGFNRQSFEELVAANRFFNMSEATNGVFEFTTGDFEAKIDRGLAEVRRAKLEGADKTLTFSGIVPYRTGSVALAGTIADNPQSDATVVKPTVSFFVGGSWPDPVISPVSLLTKAP
ncbi:AsmA-like C-terminal region-containing protein [Sinorhizobium sp. BG8]|uniref:AsmA family protein n=1 Tax=Sinorhizobium sp. BG8 TaxID=2613773 RepID=UPI00193E2865|nr:AsmA-like C-terminal region-containing protein [Sinorhizobium sp. BG8]